MPNGKRLSKWTAEALLLSDELAKELAKSDDVSVESESGNAKEKAMAIVTPGSGDVPEVEDGLYTFKIIKTKLSVREDDTFGNKGDPVLEVYCQLADTDDGEGNEVVLRPIVNLKYSQGGKYQPSTLYLFAKAAGVAPPEGQPFDTDLLEGRVLQGKVNQEEGKWPKIEPKSLMPVKVTRASDRAEAEALSEWFESLRSIGYTTKEINDHSMSNYNRLARDLSAAERDELAARLQG